MERRELLLDRPRIERRAAGVTVTGIALPFDTPALVNGAFAEAWDPHAFDAQQRGGWTIDGGSGLNRSVLALWQHNGERPLGSVAGGTLKLTVDLTALRFSLLLPDSAVDVAESIARGDAAGVSIGFRTIEDAWTYPDAGIALRRVLRGELLEVSIVSWPVYEDTSAVISGGSLAAGRSRTIAAGERRVGKVFSAKNLARLQDVHASITGAAANLRDLIDVALTGAPVDSDYDQDSIPAALAEAPASTVAATPRARPVGTVSLSSARRNLRYRGERLRFEREADAAKRQRAVRMAMLERQGRYLAEATR